MNVERLATVGAVRQAAKSRYDRAHAKALEVLVEELDPWQSGEGNVAEAARLIGVTRRTVYLALERAGLALAEREAHHNGGAPAPAPHDDDRGGPR